MQSVPAVKLNYAENRSHRNEEADSEDNQSFASTDS
jgi:hypothetical protein